MTANAPWRTPCQRPVVSTGLIAGKPAPTEISPASGGLCSTCRSRACRRWAAKRPRPSDVRHDIVCAYETERRPRGASRINPLLRLFLANYVGGVRATALVHDAISSRTNKGSRASVTDVTGLKQTQERIYPRCAARAALDLIGAEDFKANTSEHRTHPRACRDRFGS